MTPSDVPPHPIGPATRDGEERVRTLLARAVEEQASEQRALTDALAGLQQRVDDVAASLRLAASGEAVGGGLAQLGRQLQALQGELGARLAELAGRLAEQTGAAEADSARLGGVATELLGSREVLDDVRGAVQRLEPQVARLPDQVEDASRRAAVELFPRLDLLATAVQALPQTPDVVAVVQGMTTAVTARLDALDGPLDDLRGRPSGDALRAELEAVDAGVRDLPGRLDGVRGSVDVVQGSVAAVRGSVDAVQGSVDTVRGSVDDVRGGLDAARGSVDQVRHLVDVVRGDVDALPGRVEGLLHDVPRRTDVEDLLSGVARRDDVDAASVALGDRLSPVLTALGERPVAAPEDVERAAARLHDHLAGLPDRATLEGVLAGVLSALLAAAVAPLADRDALDAAASRVEAALGTRQIAGPDDVDRAAAGLHERVEALQHRLTALPDRSALEGLLAQRTGDVVGRLEALTARPALGPDDLDGALAALHARLARLEDRATASPADVDTATARLLDALLDRLPATAAVLGRLDALEQQVRAVDTRVGRSQEAVEGLPARIAEPLLASRIDLAALRGQVQDLEAGITDGLAEVVQGLAATGGRLLDGLPDRGVLRDTTAGVDSVRAALPQLEEGVLARVSVLDGRLDTADETARQTAQEMRRVAGAVAGLEQTVEGAVRPLSPEDGPTGLSDDDVERVVQAVLQRLAPALVEGVATAVRHELAAAPAPPAPPELDAAPSAPAQAQAPDEPAAVVPSEPPVAAVPPAAPRAVRPPRPAVTTAVAPPPSRRG